MKRILLGLGMLAVSACTAQQQAVVTRVGADVQAACAAVLPLASLATALPVYGPFVAAGVQVGCSTSAGLAKLASDPNSVAWLQQQAAILRGALGR